MLGGTYVNGRRILVTYTGTHVTDWLRTDQKTSASLAARPSRRTPTEYAITEPIQTTYARAPPRRDATGRDGSDGGATECRSAIRYSAPYTRRPAAAVVVGRRRAPVRPALGYRLGIGRDQRESQLSPTRVGGARGDHGARGPNP